MKSVFNAHGWVKTDNRESGGVLFEDDILGCKHCQALVHGKDWRADGGFCCVCDGPVCNNCRNRMLTHGCENFEKKINQLLDDMHRKEQNSKVLGL